MMKWRWCTGLLVLGLIFTLSGCSKESQAVNPDNPLQFSEVPLEAQTFDWSQVTTDPDTLAQGLDNYPSNVTDWVAEGINLETGGDLPAFNFEETDTIYQSVETDPNEIPLESGMPLEGSNNDPNLGLENQLPSMPINESIEEEEPAATPTPEPAPLETAEPAPTGSGDSETLPKTADVPPVVFALVGLVSLMTLIAVLKKPTRGNN